MNTTNNMISELTGAVLNEESVDDYADSKDLGKTENKILKERLTCYIEFLQEEVYPSLMKKSIDKQVV